MNDYQFIDGDYEALIATIHGQSWMTAVEVAHCLAKSIHGCVQIWQDGQMVREIE